MLYSNSTFINVTTKSNKGKSFHIDFNFSAPVTISASI